MKTLFVDVDTLKDFMNRDGALYVPGAEELKPNLGLLTQYATSKTLSDQDQIAQLCDCHNHKSKELQRNGGPFPDHAMEASDGAHHIKETRLNLDDLLVIPNRPMAGIGAMAARAPYILMQKDDYDISTNPNFATTIAAIRPDRAIVYGVATEYCVKAAALAIRNLGIETYVVTDAVKPITKQGEVDALTEMTAAGIKYTTVDDVVRGALG